MSHSVTLDSTSFHHGEPQQRQAPVHLLDRPRSATVATQYQGGINWSIQHYQHQRTITSGVLSGQHAKPKEGNPSLPIQNQWHTLIHDRKNRTFIVGTISQANFYNVKSEEKALQQPQATTSELIEEQVERTPTPEQMSSPVASADSILEPPVTNQLRLTTILNNIQTSPIQSPLMATQTIAITTACTLLGANPSQARTPNIY